jgi:hypothetical protein
VSIKPITQTFGLLHGGVFIDEASERLAELVKMVDQTGKAGTLTISLSLKKSGGAVQIDAAIKAKIPEPKPDSTLLWATVEGNLVLDNPAQQRLDLRGVEPVRGELRTAS